MMAIFDRPSIGHSVVESMTLVVLGLFLKVFVVCVVVLYGTGRLGRLAFLFLMPVHCALLVTPYTSA